jgi:hypothetical protein
MTDFLWCKKLDDRFSQGTKFKEQYGNEKRQATYLFVGLDGLYFPGVPRDAAVAADDDADRDSDGGYVCVREHDQQAARGLQAGVPGGGV